MGGGGACYSSLERQAAFLVLAPTDLSVGGFFFCMSSLCREKVIVCGSRDGGEEQESLWFPADSACGRNLINPEIQRDYCL